MVFRSTNNKMAMDLEEFSGVHEPQLKSINFPAALISDLHETFVSGFGNGKLQIDFTIKKFKNSRSMLLLNNDLKKNGSFYLIEHVWTADMGKSALQDLQKKTDVMEKLATIFNIPPMLEVESFSSCGHEAEHLATVCHCTKQEAENILRNNNYDVITSAMVLDDEELKQETVRKDAEVCTDDKCTYEEFKEALAASDNLPKSGNDAYIMKMYNNFLKSEDGCGSTLSYNWSDDGDVITVYVSIPTTAKKHSIKSFLSTKSWTLQVNGKELINGQLFENIKSDESYWLIEAPGVLCMTLEKMLSSHTWETLIEGEENLSAADILLTTWAKRQSEELYRQSILDAMWKYNQTYTVSSPDGKNRFPVWYIMDEYGSAIMHSNEPSFKCSPFFHIPQGKSYSLLWPIKDVTKGSACTRNFIPQIMPNETLDICKTRLKAFVGNKIYKYMENEEDLVNELDEYNKVTIRTLEVPKEIVVTQKNTVYLSCYDTKIIEDSMSSLQVEVVGEKNTEVDCTVVPLQETSIRIDLDVLPTGEMLVNKDYLQNYLTYRVGKCDWCIENFILPRDSVEFNKVFEKSDLPQYWIMKSVDKRVLDVIPAVSSQFARIVRSCEAGSIAVSKFCVDQPSYRKRRFALSYTVVLTNASIYIYTLPYIRLTKGEYEPNAFLNEYDISSTVSESLEKLVGHQQEEMFSDFKVSMNKTLLPLDPNKGWSVVENEMFQKIGLVSQKLLEDLCWQSDQVTCVVFGVDIIFNSDMRPTIVDINRISNLPNTTCLVDVLKLGLGFESSAFVKVL